MTYDKVYSRIGLAKRAGKAVTGFDGILGTLQKGKSFLVVAAADCSQNTAKQLRDKCRYYNIEIKFIGSKEKLGQSVGLQFASAVSIVDRNLAVLVADAFDEINGGGVYDENQSEN